MESLNFEKTGMTLIDLSLKSYLVGSLDRGSRLPRLSYEVKVFRV
jgi:hypothetical protein